VSIEQDLQSAAPGTLVELIELDATAIGGDLSRFVNKAAAPVSWGGEVFVPLEFESEGWETTGQGSLPRPKVRVDNTKQALLSLVLGCSDLRGAKVTRWLTFARYLDSGADPDPGAWKSRDVYYVDSKPDQNKQYIELELASLMDLAGSQIPARQILRDWCGRQYRRWDPDAGEFVYAHADVACPYAGTDYYDATGDLCSAAEDACGKRLSDCKLRFGTSASLPTWAYPGVALNRSSS